MTQYQKYKQQSVSALTAGEQLVLLFDQACVNLSKSAAYIAANNVSDAHNSIIRTENIFYYLIDSLDMSFPISSNLLSLYNFIIDRLTAANIKKDASIIEELRPLVCELRDTWKKAEQLLRTGVH